MGTLLYLATNKGVATVKGSDTEKWTLESQGLGSWAIPGVAVDQSNPGRAYAATRGDGVLRTDDSGKSWYKPNRGKPGPGKARCVTIDPHDPNTLYAGGEPITLWVSHDAGENWASIDTIWDVPGLTDTPYPVPAVEPHIRDVLVDANDRNTIYLNMQVGHILKTTDGCKTWTVLNKNVDADAHTLTARSDDPKRLYVSTGGHDSRLGIVTGRALYKSDDGGESWSPMALEFEQEYSVAMVVNPKDPDILYSAIAHNTPSNWVDRESGADSVVVRSQDGGATWHELDAGAEVACNFAEAMAVDPEEPENVFLATRKGQLYGSSDGGDTWNSLGITVSGASEMTAVHI
ncbi:MAG: YCF48-related protein [Dehalococcoidia bacterium]